MKIKTKLVIFMILLIFVPIMAVNLFSARKSEEISIKLIEDNIVNLTANSAVSVNFYFEKITSSARELASSDYVRKYTAASNSEEYDIPEDDYRSKIQEKIGHYLSDDPALKKIMIINNTGNIIASTDENDTGKQMPDHKSLFSLDSGKNGISPLFMDEESGEEMPVFIVVKSIYSGNNERQGIVYQLYNSSYIQKIITNVRSDKYTSGAIMDTNGNLFEYPYRSLKMYYESDNFGGASDFLENMINNSGSSEDAYEFDVKRGTRIVFSSEIPICGWTMLNISDKYSMAEEVTNSGSSIRNFSIIIIILACVASGIFIYYFTNPVDNIMDTLPKKLKGDPAAKFNIRSKDEFQEIGNVFDATFEEVFEYEQRYRAIIETTNNISFEINLENMLVTVSKNFNQKFSHRPKDDSIAESFINKLRVHKDDKERYTADFGRIMGQANTMQGEYRVKDIYGDFIWVMIKANKLYNRNDVPIKIMGVIMDIDKEKKSEMHLIQRANFDALTQLYNRETFLKTLASQISIAAGKKTLDAIMFVDLDDFKFFNDEYGHACGDEVLKFVADTLKEICFEHGFAGRFGGDEFVMCLTDLTLYGDSGKVAQEIIDTLAAGFISESTGAQLSVHCSIGIAFLIESGKTTEDVIAAADEAMYNIKKHGKSAFAYAHSHPSSAEVYLDDIM